MYDVIVIGTGGIGSAAMFELARRGVRVLGLDRFSPAHDRGSSHGETRIIRRSYFEHPDYVPLLNASYELWDDLCQRSNRQLLHRTGLVCFGPPDGVVVPGILKSAKAWHLDVEHVDPRDVASRFSGLVPPADATALFEADAGYLQVEDCVQTHIEEAVKAGAEHRHGESVQTWTATGSDVTVETSQGDYRAQKLIIAAGSWANSLLSDLRIPLRIVRKHLHWYECSDSRYFQSEGCPCFFFETQGSYFYGFPKHGRCGVKVAEHSGGTEIIDPLTDEHQPEEHDVKRVDGFVRKHLPGVSGNRTRHAVCFYTITPDENFVVDRHPRYDNVAFAAGLSGHGFKFAPVLGTILADMSIGVTPAFDIGFLACDRPALTTAT